MQMRTQYEQETPETVQGRDLLLATLAPLFLLETAAAPVDDLAVLSSSSSSLLLCDDRLGRR